MMTVVVPDYDAALRFFVDGLGFRLIEDTALGDGKRWVVVRPGERSADLLLAKAVGQEQARAIGAQAGGRVFAFLHTHDIDGDVIRFARAGARFEADVRDEPYGRVAVFADPFGNRWDLIEPTHALERRRSAP